ncbi:MAG TPA: IS91 family transposase [Candidatus Atribacteria bacterium]|nr:IS91 family transposase [Candidatus Atribacteria bacterium]
MDKQENKRHPHELAHILCDYGQQYGMQYKLCANQQKTMNAIINCRTNALGGHTARCNACGHEMQAYNSCRNKHCPKCQFIKQEQWIDKLKGRLLPVRHFHMVFTVPDTLHTIFYINQRYCYNALFSAAWQAVQKAAKNPSFLGAQTGAVALLHTWSQTLMYHPHIHMIVPAGGLSEDHMEWVISGTKFFVPIKVIGKIFRGILCHTIETGILEGNIKLPDNQNREIIKNQLYKKNWIIYAQKPLGGVNSVLQYLGRYSHRVAIANSRFAQVEHGNVSFYYKDNKNHGIQKIMTIPALEFIRRFMQHILPDNFYKIRYYGIMAAIHSQTLLEQCLALLGKINDMPILKGLSGMEVYRKITGKDPFLCPACNKGIMMILRKIPVPDI